MSQCRPRLWCLIPLRRYTGGATLRAVGGATLFNAHIKRTFEGQVWEEKAAIQAA